MGNTRHAYVDPHEQDHLAGNAASSHALPGDPVELQDGLQGFAIDVGGSEVTESLQLCLGHAAQMEQRAKQLTTHFQQAQDSAAEIERLCNEADASVKQSQALLNRTAHKIHELNERTHRLLSESAAESTNPKPRHQSRETASNASASPAVSRSSRA